MFSENPSEIIYIREQSQVDAAVSEILSYAIVGFDCETTGLDVLSGARMRLAQFAVPNGRVYLFDLGRVDKRFLYRLFPFPGLIVGQNLKFDFSFLNAELGIKSYGDCFDTMIGGQLASQGDIGSSTRFSLDALAERHLSYNLPKEQQASDWSRPELSDLQIEYAAKDAWVVLRLYERLLAVLREQNQLRVCRLEMECVPAVAEMQLNGMQLDQGRWEAQYRIALKQVKQYESGLWDFFDGLTVYGKKTGKYASKGLSDNPTLFAGARTMPLTTVKMKEAFGLKGVILPLDDNGNPTMRDFKVQGAIASGHYSAEAKKALEYAVKYAQIKKQITSYGPEWFDHINTRTNRIHQSLKQIGADTGRFSSFNPNLQQIPKGDAYRNCFVAGEGWVFVDCDYSQMELRILAEYCRDVNFLNAFDSGLDLHRYTASLIYKVKFEDVTGKQRGVAKNMNFLIVYGGGIMKLSESTGMTLDQAKVIMDLYLKQTYPGLDKWLFRQAQAAVANMFSETMTGRKRHYWGDMNDSKVRSKVERAGKNMPIQGTSVDITKRALHLTYEKYKHDPEVELCHCIHDELIARVRPNRAYEVKAGISECMLEAEREYLWRVPSAVDGAITREWAKEASPEQIQDAEDYIKEYGGN